MSFTHKSNFAPGDLVSVAIAGNRIRGVIVYVKFSIYGHKYDVCVDWMTLREVDQLSLSADLPAAQITPYATASWKQPTYCVDGQVSALARCAKANPL